MNRHTIVDLVLALTLVAVVRYYRRRERTVRESLTLSQQWPAAGAGGAGGAASDGSTAPATASAAAGSDSSALTRAASLLDARAADVPERVEQLDAKVRQLTGEVETARATWADRWWDARRAAPLDADEPHVTVVDLPDGALADAEALAKAALDDDLGVTIVVAGGEGALAVAVGAGVEGHAADEIAREVAGAAGGGAGGSPELATGGGDPVELAEAAGAVRDRLASEAGFAT